jgi:large subunit ribosomal protein L10
LEPAYEAGFARFMGSFYEAMNKDQKKQRVEEVASQIEEAGAIFAVDYRGISVPQAADLRARLGEAGASFRIVKNTLTLLALDKAGAEDLKQLLEGPTAFTFVSAEGDPALAAKALASFRREHEVLEVKGGVMEGSELSVEQIQALARLPARDVLNAQVVGMIASPITGLVRGLNQMIAGLASQLRQIADQGLVGGDAETPEAEAAPAEEPPAEEAPAEEPPAEAAPPEEAPAEDAPAETEEETPEADASEESPDDQAEEDKEE